MGIYKDCIFQKHMCKIILTECRYQRNIHRIVHIYQISQIQINWPLLLSCFTPLTARIFYTGARTRTLIAMLHLSQKILGVTVIEDPRSESTHKQQDLGFRVRQRGMRLFPTSKNNRLIGSVSQYKGKQIKIKNSIKSILWKAN